jgi:hypothetical protein
MPQFDIVCFFVQIFYVTQAFFIAYIVFKVYFLSKSAAVLKARKKLAEYTAYYSKDKGKDLSKVLYSEIIKHFK